MYRFIGLALVIAFSGFGFAGTGYYICDGINDVPEWTVHIDLNKNIASFFDNDTWAIVPLVSMRSLESNPPQKIYIFKGTKSTGFIADFLQITFNETRLRVNVKLGIEHWFGETSCRQVSSIDFDA